MKPRGNYGLGSKLTKNQKLQVPKFYMTYATGTEAKSEWTLVSPCLVLGFSLIQMSADK